MRRRVRVMVFSALLCAVGLPVLGQAESERYPESAQAQPWELMVEDDAPEGGGQLRYLRAAGSNFAPRDSSTTFAYNGAGCLGRDTNAGDSWFTLDIQLPQGAIIDSYRVYFYDDSVGNDINSELWAFNGAGGTQLIGEADSAGTPGYSNVASGAFSHVVQSNLESLVVVASIQGGVGNSLALCGVRLRYQIPQ